MKKWLISGGILILILLGCSQIWQVDNAMTIEGTVLQISEASVLLSQKKEISMDDLVKTYEEWMEGDYDLISVSNVEGVEVGMKLRVIISGTIAESYPSQTQAKSYEILNQLQIPKEESDEMTMAPENPYNQELLDIFPKTVGLNQLFNGYAEYGHFQTLKKAQEFGSVFQIIFDGMMTDGYGESVDRLFQLTYEITDEMVIEQIYNEDPYNQLKDSRLLNSIIPNKVLLKLPLEVGNSWTQTFSYQEKEYTAMTEIVRIETNKDGRVTYETFTTVADIEGDYNGCYKETRVFTTGSGMTSFSSLFSFESIGMDDEDVEQADDLYLFGYSLSAENIIIRE